MSSYLGLHPVEAISLAQTMRRAANQVDDVHVILAEAHTTSGLSLSLAPLWDIHDQLVPSARNIDFAAGHLATPIPLHWQRPQILTSPGALPSWLFRCPSSGGDPGGYLTGRLLEPLTIAQSGAQGSRALTAAVLGYLHGPDALAPDEFGVFTLDDGGEHVVVALPGVTDLNTWVRPWCAIGYDNHHQSLRDVDQQALQSWPSADLSKNDYAKAVKEWFEAAIDRGEIAPGAHVAIVGHSFGSDTAFDLAAAPEFNGELVDVDVIVGAGYDNEPFFDQIPAATQVLSLRNRKDIPALVEEKGRGILGDVWNMAKKTATSPGDAAKAVASAALVTGAELFGAWPSVITKRTPTVTEVAIDGGWKGAGHDPDNYIGYLESSEAETNLDDFWTAMAAAGFAAGGAAVAVDVSRPSSGSRSGTPSAVGGKRGSAAEVSGARGRSDSAESAENGDSAEEAN